MKIIFQLVCFSFLFSGCYHQVSNSYIVTDTNQTKAFLHSQIPLHSEFETFEEEAPPSQFSPLTPQIEVIQPFHLHNESCRHYWDGEIWVETVEEHYHGPECGHIYLEDRWCDATVEIGNLLLFAQTCQHNAHCGHYWNGSRWCDAGKRHIHRLGCGHSYTHGRWEFINTHPQEVAQKKGSSKYFPTSRKSSRKTRNFHSTAKFPTRVQVAPKTNATIQKNYSRKRVSQKKLPHSLVKSSKTKPSPKKNVYRSRKLKTSTLKKRNTIRKTKTSRTSRNLNSNRISSLKTKASTRKPSAVQRPVVSSQTKSSRKPTYPNLKK